MSRGLIKFNLTEIFDSVNCSKIKNPKFYLKLFTSEAVEVPADYTVFVNPISQSGYGVGRLFDGLTVDGVSWNYRDFDGGKPWGVS